MTHKVSVEVFYSGRNFSAYLPILPGCVATGNTPKELNERLREAVEFHVKSSLEDGDDIPDVFKGKYELVYEYDLKGRFR